MNPSSIIFGSTSAILFLAITVMFRVTGVGSTWTWLSGSENGAVGGVYGTKGIPSINNYPSGRCCHSMVFDPTLNCVYVFGGEGYAQSGTYGESTSLSRHNIPALGQVNDLWRFNISNNQWTWLSGSNVVDVNGVSGTKGVPSVDNYPGSRLEHSMIFDSAVNCIYIFGGWGYSLTGVFGKPNFDDSSYDLWLRSIE
jgi:hypothetical protein